MRLSVTYTMFWNGFGLEYQKQETLQSWSDSGSGMKRMTLLKLYNNTPPLDKVQLEFLDF
jgi:hypothetical protein